MDKLDMWNKSKNSLSAKISIFKYITRLQLYYNKANIHVPFKLLIRYLLIDELIENNSKPPKRFWMFDMWDRFGYVGDNYNKTRHRVPRILNNPNVLIDACLKDYNICEVKDNTNRVEAIDTLYGGWMKDQGIDQLAPDTS